MSHGTSLTEPSAAAVGVADAEVDVADADALADEEDVAALPGVVDDEQPAILAAASTAAPIRR